MKKNFSMMNTKEKDSQYIMHTYGRYNVALKSGKGAVAYDEDGKKYVANFVTDVYSDDNFARLDITMNGIDVSFFERKGDQLGSTYKIVF